MNSKSGLWLAAGIAALVFCPAATVIAHAIGADGSLWSKVVSTDLLPLARNTVVLAAASSVSALLLGGSAAVLTTRFRFPGQPLLVALVVSPLSRPTSWRRCGWRSADPASP